MILEFKNVSGTTKHFNLQNITFSLETGYIMGLAGKNGAGKSTLMDYIMNPKQQYKGEILIEGTNIREKHHEMMNRIGFVSDNHTGFFMERTAKENAELLGMFYKDWDMAVFHTAMEKMSLSSRRVVGRMSRGELFKFQTAFAMAHKPALYLIDEATAGMDPVFRVDYFRILQEIIADESSSILMTSHLQDEMQRKMDFVGVLEDGKLIQFGEAIDIFGKYQ